MSCDIFCVNAKKKRFERVLVRIFEKLGYRTVLAFIDLLLFEMQTPSADKCGICECYGRDNSLKTTKICKKINKKLFVG